MKLKVLPKLIPDDITYCFQYMQSGSVFLLYSDFFFPFIYLQVQNSLHLKVVLVKGNKTNENKSQQNKTFKCVTNITRAHLMEFIIFFIINKTIQVCIRASFFFYDLAIQ